MFLRKINISTLFFLITTVVLALYLIVEKSSKKEEVQYDSTVIMSKIAHIQELATIKYNYTGVIGYKDALKLFKLNVPLTEKYFLLKYNGYLKAGVDFSRVSVKLNENRVHISMPRAQIFDIVIDENSITVYNESENAFNPIKIADYNTAMTLEKETMRKDAISQGVLREANRQAELILKSFLQEMGFNEVDITLEIVIPDVR